MTRPIKTVERDRYPLRDDVFFATIRVVVPGSVDSNLVVRCDFLKVFLRYLMVSSHGTFCFGCSTV